MIALFGNGGHGQDHARLDGTTNYLYVNDVRGPPWPIPRPQPTGMHNQIPILGQDKTAGSRCDDKIARLSGFWALLARPLRPRITPPTWTNTYTSPTLRTNTYSYTQSQPLTRSRPAGQLLSGGESFELTARTNNSTVNPCERPLRDLERDGGPGYACWQLLHLTERNGGVYFLGTGQQNTNSAYYKWTGGWAGDGF